MDNPPTDASSAVAAGKDAGKSPASVSKKPLTRRTAKGDLTKPDVRKPLFHGDDANDKTSQTNDVQKSSAEEEPVDPLSEADGVPVPRKRKKL